MDAFKDLVDSIPHAGMEWHKNTLLENMRTNWWECGNNVWANLIRVEPNKRKCLIVSAGPSLYRQKSLARLLDNAWTHNGYRGVIIATDGAYIQCLRHGIVPDYVITIDPHPTRIVRWFGDPDYHQNNDGYFERQDLDISFRENAEKVNQENIDLVDKYPTRLIIACSAPANVVKRTFHMDRYWFVPLVDDPEKDGLTKEMVSMTGLPAMNTGGTVGNAAWVFAHTILQSQDIACIGMDYGYYPDTPYEQTQEWNMLKDLENFKQYYPKEKGYWNEGYISPTYYWYRQNLRDLLKAGDGYITNCTEGGFLTGFRVSPLYLEEWLYSGQSTKPTHTPEGFEWKSYTSKSILEEFQNGKKRWWLERNG